jgi:hypothetical protein
MSRANWGITEIPTRHAPFGGATGAWNIDVTGIDWSAATFVLAAATEEGAAAVFTLGNATAGTEGVSASYDAAMVDPVSGKVTGGTVICPQVDEATLEAISWGTTPTNEPLPLFWELLVTPVSEPQRQLCCGTLRLYRGVGD